MPGDIIREADLRSTINITVEGTDAVQAAERAVRKLATVLGDIASGYDLNKYWKTQMSTLEGVTEAYDRFNKATSQVAKSQNATILTKSFNSFIAQGGNAADLMTRYGDEFESVINAARDMTPVDINRIFDVSSLKEKFQALNTLFGDSKADIDSVMTALSRPNTAQLETALNQTNDALAEMRRRAAEAERQIEILGGSGRLEELQAQLENFRDGAMQTFNNFVYSNGLSEFARYGRLDTFYENLKDGTWSAEEAISRLKYEYEDLIREASSSGASIAPEALSGFTEEIGRISAGVEAVMQQIEELKGAMARGSMPATNGAIATGIAEELSHSAELTEAQRTAMVDLINQTGGVRSVTEVLVELIQNSSAATESANTLYDSISRLVDSIARLSTADGGHIESITNALRTVNAMDNLTVSGNTLTAITDALDSISKLPQTGAFNAISNVNLKGFNDLSVSKASLRNLADYLPIIGAANVGNIAALAGIDWTNLKELKVSKASVDNLANLAKIADTIEELRARIESVENVNGMTLTPFEQDEAIATDMEAEAAAIDHVVDRAKEEADALRDVAAANEEAASGTGAVEQSAAANERAVSDVVAQYEALTAQYHAAEAELQRLNDLQSELIANGDLVGARAIDAEISAAEQKELDAIGAVEDFRLKNADAIEQEARARAHAADEANVQAEAARSVVEAESEAAAQNAGDQIAAQHERAAEAAREQAAAEEQVAQAAAEAANAGADAAVQGAEGAEQAAAKIAEQAAFLQRVEEIRKQIGLYQINQPDAYAQNKADIDALMAALDQAAANGKADIEQIIAGFREMGVVSEETIGQLEAAFSGFSTDAAFADASRKQEESALALEASVVKLRDQYEALRRTNSQVYKDHQAEIDESIAKMERSGSVTKRELNEMRLAYAKYNEEIRKTNAELKLQQDATKLSDKIQKWADVNPKAYAAYRQQIDGMMRDLQGDGLDPTQLQKISAEFNNIAAAANHAGLQGQTFFQKLQAGWQKFAGWSLVTRSFMLVIRGIKSMINSVKELDAAMTELKKVTDLTAVGYEQFYEKAVQTATSIGASVSDTINATAD